MKASTERGVLSRILGEDENVVEKRDDKVVKVWTEDVIHSTFEKKQGRW
jgi:hypothetical protein